MLFCACKKYRMKLRKSVQICQTDGRAMQSLRKTVITDKGFNENQISVRSVGTSRGRVRPLPVLYVSLRQWKFHYANIVKFLKTTAYSNFFLTNCLWRVAVNVILWYLFHSEMIDLFPLLPSLLWVAGKPYSLTNIFCDVRVSSCSFYLDLKKKIIASNT